jgi:hypothetical protein
VLNGPPFDDCVVGAELPKMLPEVADDAGAWPNKLLGGLKVEVDWLNSELEEEVALAGLLNDFAAGCEVFVDCPNNDVCGSGSSGFCGPKPNRLPG